MRRRTLIGLTACLLSAGGLLGSFGPDADVALRKALANASMSFRSPPGVKSFLWGTMYLRVVSVGWSSEIAVVRESLQYLLRDGFE